MEPLFDRHGRVAAFLGERRRIVSPAGESLGWIHENESVYDYRGGHLGWWDHDHLRAHDGSITLWLREAHDLGVVPPTPAEPPAAPTLRDEPPHPHVGEPPRRPANRRSWSDYAP